MISVYLLLDLPFYFFTFLLLKKARGDQRWNRWERGQEGEKPLCTSVPSDSIAGPPFKTLFLPFYLFTFLPLKAFFSPLGAQDKA